MDQNNGSVFSEKSWNLGNSSLPKKVVRTISVIAGIALIIAALVSLFNMVSGFLLDGLMLWLNLFYIALNVFATWGLFYGQKWIVPIFGMNWLSTLIIFVMQNRIAFDTVFNITSHDGLMIISSTTLFLFVLASRQHLSGKYFNITFATFIVLWATSLILNFANFIF